LNNLIVLNTMEKTIKLSILDQSLIPFGGSATQAIQQTVELVKLAEQWGYDRFWVSEHHNLSSVAGSAPEVLMAKLASETTRIRIGSGGIMLPNHSALKVAENFRVLEALYPGRIDLGIGRAPGGDRITAALLNPSNNFSEQSYLNQLDHLQIFFRDEAGTEYGKIVAVPQVSTIPQQWMLSSSGGSSAIAAKYGMGLAVAKFINGKASSEVVERYKESFIPSEQFPNPKVAVSIVVLCADTEEKSLQLKKSVDYQFLQMDKRNFEGIQKYEAIKDYKFSLVEREILKAHRGKVVYGTKDQVKVQLEQLATEFEAEDVIAVTWAADYEDRKRSFELLAEVFN
jgi:luciferase family oxidoreductase group 1